MPFLMKVLEKIIDRLIKDTVLVDRPLHRGQLGYQVDKSCETALHYLKNLVQIEIMVGNFVDIECAFERIEKALERKHNY